MSKCTCNERPWYPKKVMAKVNGFERTISFKPGFRCENSGPTSHGQHRMDMIWFLKGPLGGIQFIVYTGWSVDGKFTSHGMAADIGAHSYKPTYDGQEKMSDSCPWIDNKPCYYDGSGLQAEEVFKILCKEGEEACWAEMEKYYRSWLVKDKNVWGDNDE